MPAISSLRRVPATVLRAFAAAALPSDASCFDACPPGAPRCPRAVCCLIAAHRWSPLISRTTTVCKREKE